MLSTIFVSPLQAGARITGTVTDKEGQPLTDVNIRLIPSPYGTTTDTDGFFYLPRIANGFYKLQFNHIAYQPKEIEIKSYSTDKIKLNVKLSEIEYALEAAVFTVKGLEAANKTVIDRRVIEESNSSSIEGILQNRSSIHVTKTGNTASKISIRGSNTNQVAIMLDGVAVNSRMDGSFDLNSIPAEAVERIEIYKGGDIELSSQAIGGIINIVTRQDYKLKEASAAVKYSNRAYLSDRDQVKLSAFDNQSYAFTTNFQAGDNKVFFTCTSKNNNNQWSYINAAKADRYRYDNSNPNGYLPNTPRIHDNSTYRSINMLATINGNIEKVNYNFLTNFVTDNYGLPGWYDIPFHEAYTEGSDYKNRLNLQYKHPSKKEFTLTLYNDQSSRFTYINEISQLYYSDHTDKYANRGIKGKIDIPSSFMSLKSGFEYNFEGVTSANIDGDKTREISSAYATFEKKLLENKQQEHYLKAFGGARGDYISTQKNVEDFYSLGLLAQLKHQRFTILPKVKFEENYRLPTFSDLFWIDNMSSSGNPELKPEYSETKEASLTISYEGLLWDITSSFELYRKNMTNLIVWEKQSSGKYVPVNRRGGEINGTETMLKIGFISNIFQLKGTYSTLDSRSFTYKLGTDNKKIIYKPENSFNGSFSYDYQGLNIDISGYYNGKMFLNERNTIDIDPFWLFATNVSYQHKLNDRISIRTYINIENLADKQYQIVYGYPMPGRSIELGLKVNL